MPHLNIAWMRARKIGLGLVILGLALAFLVFAWKASYERTVSEIVAATGSCFLEDGTCLHAANTGLLVTGWVISGLLIAAGVFLYMDRTQEQISKANVRVSEALREAKRLEKDKDEWHSFLKGFDHDERKVLSAIKEQDGILQSTLRYRTGLSKSSLSLLLKDLEEREIVSRKPEGRTNKVFLRQ
jgi:uncharacterized membrane protein